LAKESITLGMSRKIKKPRKPKKSENNNKKPNREKKSVKPIKILKKQTGSVRFRFYKPKIKKTKLIRIDNRQ
jgi:hypothetical protein